MTLEQIVNTHPCPIIRGKIMENVSVPNYEKSSSLSELTNLILYGINDWEDTRQGGDFWNSVYMDHTATYSDLKHLDNSYVPEPAKPPVMWRKIDKDKLPNGKIAARHSHEIEDMQFVYVTENTKRLIAATFTHYIPLSDLINLPIED